MSAFLTSAAGGNVENGALTIPQPQPPGFWAMIVATGGNDGTTYDGDGNLLEDNRHEHAWTAFIPVDKPEDGIRLQGQALPNSQSPMLGIGSALTDSGIIYNPAIEINGAVVSIGTVVWLMPGLPRALPGELPQPANSGGPLTAQRSSWFFSYQPGLRFFQLADDCIARFWDENREQEDGWYSVQGVFQDGVSGAEGLADLYPSANSADAYEQWYFEQHQQPSPGHGARRFIQMGVGRKGVDNYVAGTCGIAEWVLAFIDGEKGVPHYQWQIRVLWAMTTVSVEPADDIDVYAEGPAALFWQPNLGDPGLQDSTYQIVVSNNSQSTLDKGWRITVEWDAQDCCWYPLVVPQRPIRYGVVQERDSNYDDYGHPLMQATVHLCDRDGGNEGDDDATVYLLAPDGKDPAIFSLDIVAFSVDNTVLSDCTDDKKGTIKLFSAGEGIPDGWSLCDGENGTMDLRSQFVVGLDPRVSGQMVGDTGGSSDFTHCHDVNVCGTINVQGGPGSTEPVVHPIYPVNLTSNAYYGEPGSTTGFQRTDGRPPFYVLAFIQRVK